jgi:hypothetical protein
MFRGSQKRAEELRLAVAGSDSSQNSSRNGDLAKKRPFVLSSDLPYARCAKLRPEALTQAIREFF